MRCMVLILVVLGMMVPVGCGPRLPKPPKPTIVNAEGKPPKTVAEWAELVNEAAAKEKQATEERKAAEDGLRQAKVSSLQTKLYVISGMALLAFLGCVALAVFLPAFKKQAIMGGLAALAVAGCAWALSWLVPYMLWAGLGLLALLGVAGIVYWKRNDKALEGVVRGVEAIKAKVPDYKATFKSVIDTRSDELITSIRKRLGLIK